MDYSIRILIFLTKDCNGFKPWPTLFCDGILEQSMGARNRVGIGLSCRPARLHRLLESIPGLLKGLKIPSLCWPELSEMKVCLLDAMLPQLLPSLRAEILEASGLRIRIRIRINLSCWIRIRIGIQIQEGKNGPQKKSTEFSCFEVLDVLFWGLKASPVAWAS